MRIHFKLHRTIFFLCILAVPIIVFSQTAEITLSGSTWTTQIGGKSVYSGSSLGDAIRKAISDLGNGTINIRNPGNLDGKITPNANQTFDFHENEMSGGSFGGFSAKHTNGISIRNFNLKNGKGSMTFNGCSNLSFHNIVLLLDGAGGVRVDNDKYSRPVKTTNFKVTGGMRVEGSRSDGMEVYSVEDIEIDRFIAKNCVNGCGLILNDSRNVKIGYINSYRSPASGGYAGFRTANSNGPNVVVDTLITVDCGRGYFSVSKSRGTTIKYVNISGSTTHGMLIQNASDVHILSGVIWNNNCAEAIRFSTDPQSAGGYMDCKNNSIENVRVFDNRGASRKQTYGIRETSDGGKTSLNKIINCDLRDAGSSKKNDLILEGTGSNATGTALTGDPAILDDEGRKIGATSVSKYIATYSNPKVMLNGRTLITTGFHGRNVDVCLFNMRGQMIQKQTFLSNRSHPVSFESMISKGTFILKINDGYELISKKISIIK